MFIILNLKSVMRVPLNIGPACYLRSLFTKLDRKKNSMQKNLGVSDIFLT